MNDYTLIHPRKFAAWLFAAPRHWLPAPMAYGSEYLRMFKKVDGVRHEFDLPLSTSHDDYAADVEAAVALVANVEWMDAHGLYETLIAL